MCLIVSLPNLAQAGLVPCGLSEDDPEQPGDQTAPCTFCHFFALIDNIVKFVLFRIVAPIAVLMLVIGGIMLFFAGGSPGTLNKAKSILISTAIGLVVIFSAWVIINTVLTFPGLVSADFGWNPEDWFKVECQ